MTKVLPTKEHNQQAGRDDMVAGRQSISQQRHELNVRLAQEREALDQRQHVADLLEVHDLFTKLRDHNVQRVTLSLDDGTHYYIESVNADRKHPSRQTVEDTLIGSCIPWQALRRADVSGQSRLGTVVLDLTKDPAGVSRAELEEQLRLITAAYRN